MGADFVRKAAKAFEKSWDRGRTALCTADLFTQTPNQAAHTAAAEMLGDVALRPGDHVTVEKSGQTLVARKGLTPVAQLNSPSAELVGAIDASADSNVTQKLCWKSYPKNDRERRAAAEFY
jgi:hypothetical protein